MGKILCFTVALIILHGVHSYILLTANMDDVHNVIKQLTSSPVIEQIKQIWRRAATQFKNEVNKPTRRHGADGGRFGSLNETGLLRRRNIEALLALGNNATQYLQIAQQILDRY